MILLIDNYDSFVFNVAQYLQELTEEEVKTVRNDAITWEEITATAPPTNFDVINSLNLPLTRSKSVV